MNLYLTLAVLLVLALLQSTIMPHVTLWGVHPDLVLMVVTSWSLLRGGQEGMLWALLGGVLLDLFSGARFGVYTLPMLIVSFLTSLSARNVFRFDLLIPVLVTPLASLVYNGLSLTMLNLLGWSAPWGEGMVRLVLPSMLLNSLAMPIIYLAMCAVDRRTGREEITW